MNAKSDKPRRKKTAERPPCYGVGLADKDRRKIAEELLSYRVKIRKSLLYMDGWCNALIFR